MWSGAFGKHVAVLGRAMDVAVLRRSVIANNVANAETPNFKRSVVNFEAQLAKALRSSSRQAASQLVSDPRHIPFQQSLDYRDVAPRRVLDYLTTAKNNGNNVDIEVETMALLENQLLYQTLSTAVASQYSRINIVLR